MRTNSGTPDELRDTHQIAILLQRSPGRTPGHPSNRHSPTTITELRDTHQIAILLQRSPPFAHSRTPGHPSNCELRANSGTPSKPNSGTPIKLRTPCELRNIHQTAIFLQPSPPFAHSPQLTAPASCAHDLPTLTARFSHHRRRLPLRIALRPARLALRRRPAYQVQLRPSPPVD